MAHKSQIQSNPGKRKGGAIYSLLQNGAEKRVTGLRDGLGCAAPPPVQLLRLAQQLRPIVLIILVQAVLPEMISVAGTRPASRICRRRPRARPCRLRPSQTNPPCPEAPPPRLIPPPRAVRAGMHGHSRSSPTFSATGRQCRARFQRPRPPVPSPTTSTCSW